MRWVLVLLAWWCVGAPALAQSIDAWGPPGAPASGDRLAPVRVGHPVHLDPGQYALSGGLRYAHRPLVRWVDDVPAPIVADAAALDLGAVVAVHRRVALAARMGVRHTLAGVDRAKGPAFGDVVLWAPIGLLVPPEPGVSAALVPFVALPTGSPDRFSGPGRARAGGSAVVDWRGGGWAAAVELGAGHEPAGTAVGIPGGTDLRLGAGWTRAVGARHALGAEVRGFVPLGAEARAARGVPVEVGVFGRGGDVAGLSWMADVSVGFGPSLPAIGVGVSAAWGSRDRAAAGQPGAVLAVVDPSGAPVRGAELRIGDDLAGTTDADGTLQLPSSWSRAAVISAPGFEPQRVERTAEPGVMVTLVWSPVPVTVLVTDVLGARLPADLVATPAAPAVERLEVGRLRTRLTPGTWDLEIRSPRAQPQSRTVIVAPGRTEPVEVQVVMGAPGTGPGALDLTVTDPEGRPVDGAFVLLDGTPLGTAGPGGRLGCGGLKVGPHTLFVESGGFHAPATVTFDAVAGGPTPVHVAVGYASGAVRVVARDGAGRVVRGEVQFSGDDVLPWLPLDASGERVVRLEDGTWRARLRSPGMADQERTIKLDARTATVVVLDVTFHPTLGGRADLLLGVVDRAGTEGGRAEVWIDDLSYGTTWVGGSLRIRNLTDGPHRVVVQQDGMLPAERTLELSPGLQETTVALDWAPGSARVRARSAADAPVAALVRLVGPDEVASVQLDATGTHIYRGLAPGPWQAMASEPEFGLQEVAFEVPADTPGLVDALVILGSDEGGTARLRMEVVDPRAEPVRGAEVWLAGRFVGTTDAAGVLEVGKLSAGERAVEVRALGHQPATVKVRLASGRLTRRGAELAYAPGAVLVTATSPAGPVTDGMLRIAGPTARDTLTLDATGRRLIALEPGTWRVLVLSPSAGMREEEIVVPAVAGDRLDLALVLGGDTPQTVLRVVDSSGVAVRGAAVMLNGDTVGLTRADGSFVLPPMTAPAVALYVAAPGYHDFGPETLLLSTHQERVIELDWATSPVPVEVVDARGLPRTARIDVSGRGEVPSVTIDGTGTVDLPPGRWTLVASAEGLAPTATTVEVDAIGAAPLVRFALAEARISLTGDVLSLLDVQFGIDEDTARPVYRTILAELAALLMASPDILVLEIQGHTDDTGSVEHNLDLSRRRAESVFDALVAIGVPPSRLLATGYGPLRPLSDDPSPEGRARNRRVAFEVVERATGSR